jgi:hypothetical protein
MKNKKNNTKQGDGMNTEEKLTLKIMLINRLIKIIGFKKIEFLEEIK